MGNNAGLYLFFWVLLTKNEKFVIISSYYSLLKLTKSYSMYYFSSAL